MPGVSCTTECGGIDKCDDGAMQDLTIPDIEVILRDLGDPRLPAPRSSDPNLFCGVNSRTTNFGLEPYVQPERTFEFRCVFALNPPANCDSSSNNVYRVCGCLVPDVGVTGDPHIDTFKGEHYLLLKQGTFSLWHLSGSLFCNL